MLDLNIGIEVPISGSGLQRNPRISGGVVEGNMVLLDEPAEGSPLNRITWTPSGDDHVRQQWETSTDGGRTWSSVFYGVYSRKKPTD